MSWENIRNYLKGLVDFKDELDMEDSIDRIRKNIWFRGPNVWILAFAIILASVGLNVNSTAVIIGAMLVSPLMGPIIGIGLSLGIGDLKLLRDAAYNLLVMVVISLIASTIYFLISPLDLINSSELAARTSPTIYDVIIALFGGLAGILETSRKDRGTVLSGVAIATALMPPLCTAGYGLSNGNWHYFFGASYLFIINGVFIILATFAMVKYLKYPVVESYKRDSKRLTVTTLLLLIFIVPSIISAVSLVNENNFKRSVNSFIEANKSYRGGYIYDYKIEGQDVTIFVAGDPLSDDETILFKASAEAFGLNPDRMVIKENNFGTKAIEKMAGELAKTREEAEKELRTRDEIILMLKEELEEERAAKDASSDQKEAEDEPEDNQER
ncbi:MAG: DUF389 domain-containing protein [Bacteroidales bacterium]|nr:DUF389 domain-containing protein [Bacteroidales bacterium]